MTKTLTDLLVAAHKGALVLTVNQRLARYLVQGYDSRLQEQGCTAWKSPAIHFHLQWQWQMAARLRLDAKTLGPAQALRLWERAVEEEEKGLAGNGLMRVPDAARAATQAHQLLCEYGATFTSEEGGEDHRAFLRWRSRWQQLCREGGWDDPALVPARLVTALEKGELPVPDDLWLAGFDELSPTIEALCSCPPETRRDCSSLDAPCLSNPF
ncbi:MAG: hypothetical protein BA870_08265 [Desulfuromonadales bacterium C00003094]|nr:MAG: hypothetical protein BA870_08265 [Desulfuromonadales bacterium C00003094]